MTDRLRTHDSMEVANDLTVGDDLVVAGDASVGVGLTVGDDLTVTGDLTAFGLRSPKVTPGKGYLSNAWVIPNTAGQNAVVTNQWYVCQVDAPRDWQVNGIGYWVGGTPAGASDKAIVALWDNLGAVVAGSALAGKAAPTVTITQDEVPFLSAPITIRGPDTYWMGISFNAITAHHLRMWASTGANTIHVRGTPQTGYTWGAAIPVLSPIPTAQHALDTPRLYLY